MYDLNAIFYLCTNSCEERHTQCKKIIYLDVELLTEKNQRHFIAVLHASNQPNKQVHITEKYIHTNMITLQVRSFGDTQIGDHIFHVLYDTLTLDIYTRKNDQLF